MANNQLGPPSGGPTFDWRFFKDWLYRLWTLIRNFDLTGTTVGTTQIDGNLVVTGNLTSGINPLGRRRRTVNGSCLIIQRGSSTFASPSSGYAGPDHFFAQNASAGGSFTQGSVNLTYQGTTYPAVQQVVATANTDITAGKFWQGIVQGFEGFQVADLVGSPVSISFLVNTNWTGNLSVCFRYLSASPYYTFLQSIPVVSGVTKQVTITTPPVPAGVTTSYTSSYQADILIGALNSGSYNTAASNSWISNASVAFATASNFTNWGATIGNSLTVTNLQLEKGPPTPFESWDLEAEFLACLRYTHICNFPLRGVISGTALIGRAGCFLMVPMRVAPTITGIVGASFFDGSVTAPVSSINASFNTIYSIEMDLNFPAASWGTIGRAAILYQQGVLLTALAEVI
jgi:hypothetical protein